MKGPLESICCDYAIDTFPVKLNHFERPETCSDKNEKQIETYIRRKDVQIQAVLATLVAESSRIIALRATGSEMQT